MPKPVAQPKPKVNYRLVFRLMLWVAIFASLAFATKEVHSFFVKDPRFRFERLEIRGTVYTNRARVQNIFAADFNRGIFEIPLAERRRHVLAVDWVRTASVMRVWPNRIIITVTERKPVAFAKLQAPGTMRHWLALIDDEGILLSIPPKVRFGLPIISGISEEQSDEERKMRVQAMLHLMADLGPQSKDVSEVNAASTQDLRLIADVDGQAVELWIGDQRYRSRYMNFLSHYPEIRRREERASVFDLRLDDRITTR
jgi:cell division protein FtsQ